MTDYETPSWGLTAAPNDDNNVFNLEVLKGGQIIQVLKLQDKGHFILGRQPDICDFCLDHSSISRKHAILQYRDDNALMLINFGGNGSYINKKACSNGVYHRLHVGDIIKFGESTRLYVVNGPEEQRPSEHDSANMQAYRSHLTEKSKKIEKDKKSTESDGVGWGFREDAVNDEYEEEKDEDAVELPDYIKKDEHYDRKYGEKYTSSLRDDDVNEKDQKLLEKVRKYERKIQNMQEEISRIYMKEGRQDEGLTAGQTAAVERNDKRIEVLKAELVALEAQIRGKQNQRTTTTENHKERTAKRNRNEEDESGLDTTAETMDASTNWRLKKKLAQSGATGSRKQGINGNSLTTNGGSLTYAGLKSAWDVEQKELMQLQGEVDKCRSVLASAGGSHQHMDGLDAYMRDSQMQEAQVSLKKLLVEVDSRSASLNRLSKLMKVAAPALSSLHSSTENEKKLTSVAGTKDTVSASSTGDKTSATSDMPSAATTMDSELAAKGSVISNTPSANSRGDDTTSEAEPDDGFMSRSTFQSKGSIRKSNVADSNSKNAVAEKRKREGTVEGLGDYSSAPSCEDDTTASSSNSGNQLKKRAVSGPSSDSQLPNQDSRAEGSDALKETLLSSSTQQPKNGPQKGKKVAGAAPPPKAGARPREDDANVSYSSSTLEGGDAVWCPPKGQTGDGKTSLNAKYGY